MTDEVEEEIERQLSESKGIGNFSTILVNIPGGDEKGVQFIQMGDIGANDEFANVKTSAPKTFSTRTDSLRG